MFQRRGGLTWKRVGVLLLCWLVLAATRPEVGAVQGRGNWSLAGTLRQLDTEAKNFHSLSADVERTKVTVVVNDRSTETGTILVRGDKMLLEMKAPDARTILRTGDAVYIYTPGLKRVEEYSLGKNRAVADQFLKLGFGTSGKDLEKSYLVTLQGESVIDDRKTVELELTPKSSDVRNEFSKIQIWFDESTWLPVEQQLYETGSGDYEIVHYSKMVKNAGIPDSKFKPHWPSGTQQIKR